MKQWNNNPLIRQFEQFRELSPHHNQAVFARKCGISRAMMSRYLGNKVLVSSGSLEKICDALKCKAKDVIGSEDE